jgi:tetratricopeptide (TPR) repeat protein
VEIDGVQVRTFAFNQGPSVYFATSGNDVLMACSRAAMTKSIQAKKSGKSVLTDAAFTPALARFNENTTKLAALHAARGVKIAKHYMPPQDFQEVAPYVGVLTETAASISIDSNTLLRLSAQVTGLPDVSGVVAQIMANERRDEQSREELTRLIENEKWDEALAKIDVRLLEKPSTDLLLEKFDVLATRKKDREAALPIGQEIMRRAHDDAKALNNFAWALLTDEDYGLKFNELALKLSERSNDLTGHQSWVFLDTLALAKFETGDVQAAIELEKKAISLAGAKVPSDLREALARFEAARDKSRSATAKSGTD